LTTRIYTSAPQCRWLPHSYATPTPPREPTSRALPCPLCADDRRRDRASALVRDASSRRLCSPRSGTEAAANPVSGLRAPPRRTQDAVDTCGQRGYAALDRARGGAPGALHSKSGLCEPERTPAVRPRPSRASGGDADGASPCAAEPCEPRQVGRSSGKRPTSGATRGLGRSHHPRHGRPGRNNACARSLPPCVTPPPAHGILLRRADGPRRLPLHHMTPHHDPERAPIPWRPPSLAGPGAAFTTGKLWLPLVADAARLNVESQATDPRSTLWLVRRLAASPVP